MTSPEQNHDQVHEQFVRFERLKTRGCGCLFSLVVMSSCALLTLAAAGKESATPADLPLIALGLAIGFVVARALIILNGDDDRLKHL